MINDNLDFSVYWAPTSILNHSTLEIKNHSQKGLRLFKTWWIDVFSNADSEKPHMTVGKNASLVSYR